MSEPDGLYTDLHAMWSERDPVPDDLADKVLVAIATEDLDREYELLHLVERSRDLAGARSVGEALTISFAVGDIALMLRVSPTQGGRCRVDGWVTPPGRMRVSLTQQDLTVKAVVDERGRFEFADVPLGLSRFWLTPFGDESDDADARFFSTPIVEL